MLKEDKQTCKESASPYTSDFKKPYIYIYRCHIIVQNDHKPLEMIQKKPIHAAPPQLQCMLLWLQKNS